MQSSDAFIQSLVREAGALAARRFGKEGVHFTKSAHIWDVVTKADLEIEKYIAGRIRKAYPVHGIIAEESETTNPYAEYVWTIDPIDGTANFASGIPLFGVMVSLVHRKQVILAAVYLPLSDELFFAKARCGAYRNGVRIRSAKTAKLERSFGMSSSSLWLRTARFMRNLVSISQQDHMMLGAFGSIAVNATYVACGRRDWFVQLVGSPWDFAPVSLILKEAGCKVTDANGKPWKLGVNEMVAANPALHKQLLKLTKNI